MRIPRLNWLAWAAALGLVSSTFAETVQVGTKASKALGSENPLEAQSTTTNQFEPAIRAFEAADRTNPPPSGAILFTGASNIRLWKNVAEAFPGHRVFNRGFGGAQMSDLVEFAGRIVVPYRPKVIILYAGDNDLAAGKSPEQVLADFAAFARKVHASLPQTVIGCLAVKPSPSRAKLVSRVQATDALLEAFCRTNENAVYLDDLTPMLNAAGGPRPELFGKDGLHLNEKGRAVWVSLIQPVLDRYDPPASGTPRLSAPAGEIVLEDDSMLVAFDSDTGALTRMEGKPRHWVIERRPELGLSFRLFAPLPNRRYNPVLGQKQHVAEVKKVMENEVRLQWKDLVSENGGVLPMKLTARVTLTNGVVTFGATLENDSPLTVETIDYPYFGDFNAPGRGALLEARTLKGGKVGQLQVNEVYPHFRNEKGYWGVTYPTKTLEAQQSPFCLLQAPDQGLYVGTANPTAAYRLQYTFEQHPGVLSTVTSLVPQQDEISGFPVHLEFGLCHFVFAPPHSTNTLIPIAVRPYDGDWHHGVALLQQRRSSPSH
jgi:lysophospholipase L1-like esterase